MHILPQSVAVTARGVKKSRVLGGRHLQTSAAANRYFDFKVTSSPPHGRRIRQSSRELTLDEANDIHSSRYQIGTLKRGHNIKYLPYAFTQEGVAMLSGVLLREVNT